VKLSQAQKLHLNLPPVPLDWPGCLMYFSMSLCLMVELLVLLGQSDAMRRHEESYGHT